MRSGVGLGSGIGSCLIDELAEREPQLAQALVAHRGDLEDAVAARLELGAHEVGELARLGHVDLVEGDELRALEQRHLALGHGVGGELGEDDVEVGDRVAARARASRSRDVQQRRAALDVAQELESEALALAGALDEAGHVGDGEAVVAGLRRRRGSGAAW